MENQSPSRSDFLSTPTAASCDVVIPETPDSKDHSLPTPNNNPNNTKSFDFGVFFEPDKFYNVKPVLSKLKHLTKKKVGRNHWLFDTNDIIKIINTGQRTRKKCIATQTDWIKGKFSL